MSEIKKSLQEIRRNALEQQRVNSQLVDHFLYEAKKIMLVPCSNLLETFPRIVRDLARDLGKEVELQITGSEIQVDKRVMALLKDPLLHLVRNALDHGIERPSDRLKAGKRDRAVLTLKIGQLDARTIEIVVSDDGAGINLQKVKQQAVKQKIAGPHEVETMNTDQLLSLIFAPSFSTSALITDISGRGLGLSIVKDAVSNVGGRLSLHTEEGKGTEFQLTVPVTLATFRGMFIDCAEQLFAIPTINFESVFRVETREIMSVEGVPTVTYNNRRLRVSRLSDLLSIDYANKTAKRTNVAILTCDRGSLPVVIDRVLGEQEVLVKSLGPPIERVPNISGVTVLGSGRVVPVLDVAELFDQAQKISKKISLEEAQEAPKARKVLVVDDTLAARMLLQNILTSAGFLVQTASDGGQALAELKKGEFDLLVTDVEMPVLTGFELTKSVRQDERLRDLPVILVTALASREDRERGIEVGASAYFVKSSFDQDNLLEVVNKLI